MKSLYVLRSGAVEIVRGGATVAVVDEPSSLLGEMSLLLDRPASASVRARTEVVVDEVPNARQRIEADAEFAGRLARLLARRVESLTGHLVEFELGTRWPHAL